MADDGAKERHPAGQLDGVVVEAAVVEDLGGLVAGPNLFMPRVSSGDVQQAECDRRRSEEQSAKREKMACLHPARTSGGGGDGEGERESVRALLFLAAAVSIAPAVVVVVVGV